MDSLQGKTLIIKGVKNFREDQNLNKTNILVDTFEALKKEEYFEKNDADAPSDEGLMQCLVVDLWVMSNLIKVKDNTFTNLINACKYVTGKKVKDINEYIANFDRINNKSFDELAEELEDIPEHETNLLIKDFLDTLNMYKIKAIKNGIEKMLIKENIEDYLLRVFA